MWHMLGQYNALDNTGTLWMRWKSEPPIIAVALWSDWEKVGRALKLDGFYHVDYGPMGEVVVSLPGAVRVWLQSEWVDEFFDQLLIALDGMDQKRSEGLKGYYTSLVNLYHRN